MSEQKRRIWNGRAFAVALLGMCTTALHAQTIADPCATAPATCATTISTRATSQTRIPNNAVDISLGVQVTEKTAEAAQRSLTQATTALMSYLRGEAVTRLVTGSVSFEPQTRSEKNRPDQIVGYSGSGTVSFRADPDHAPDLLANALTHGANSISGVSFLPKEEDVAKARQELATRATREALEQAEAISKAAGLRVVAAKSIQVENGEMPVTRPMMYARAMGGVAGAAPAPPPVPTAAGDQEISVSVDVVVAAAH